MNRTLAQIRVRAPEFSGGKGWLNTDKPLSLAALKGKVVLLDFWTYGCINCIHIIPDLKKLEAKYAKQLVVIGVHSAKFDNEKDTDNIRNIILRYEIEHPIVNDADFTIWNSYAVRAWPTRILIDPDGYVVREFAGEGYYDEIDKLIQGLATDFRAKGKLDEKPLKLALERAKVGDLPLAFPGKVLADEPSKRLFIADSNHNRIVITDLNGKLIETIGSGVPALKDGDFASSNFSRPQGMALDGDSLYVADTENHAIRRIDLKAKTVETISGDGRQAEWRAKGGDAKTSRLSSPWDLVKIENSLFIAMAGTHQIWRLDLEKHTVAPYAGSGAEARYDGPNDEAAFAQPSGITTDGKNLFIADSESNIIRKIDIQNETVDTLVGGDLFEFGDRDGVGDDVRLQHPLGIAIYGSKLLLTDTYNHKIKLLDTERNRVNSFIGTGKPGQIDGANAALYEPGGLSIAENKLYIADTNNHAIRVIDLAARTAKTLKIDGLAPPAVVARESDGLPNGKEITLEPREVSANSTVSLDINIELPAGFHLNPSAPQRLEIEAEKGQNVSVENLRQRFTKLPISVPLKTLAEGESVVKVSATVYYCREDNTGVCMIKSLVWKFKLKVATNKSNPNRIEIREKLN